MSTNSSYVPNDLTEREVEGDTVEMVAHDRPASSAHSFVGHNETEESELRSYLSESPCSKGENCESPGEGQFGSPNSIDLSYSATDLSEGNDDSQANEITTSVSSFSLEFVVRASEFSTISNEIKREKVVDAINRVEILDRLYESTFDHMTGDEVKQKVSIRTPIKKREDAIVSIDERIKTEEQNVALLNKISNLEGDGNILDESMLLDHEEDPEPSVQMTPRSKEEKRDLSLHDSFREGESMLINSVESSDWPEFREFSERTSLDADGDGNPEREDLCKNIFAHETDDEYLQDSYSTPRFGDLLNLSGASLLENDTIVSQTNCSKIVFEKKENDEFTNECLGSLQTFYDLLEDCKESFFKKIPMKINSTTCRIEIKGVRVCFDLADREKYENFRLHCFQISGELIELSKQTLQKENCREMIQFLVKKIVACVMIF